MPRATAIWQRALYLSDKSHGRETGSRSAAATVHHQTQLPLTTPWCNDARVVGTSGEVLAMEGLVATSAHQPVDGAPHPAAKTATRPIQHQEPVIKAIPFQPSWQYSLPFIQTHTTHIHTHTHVANGGNATAVASE